MTTKWLVTQIKIFLIYSLPGQSYSLIVQATRTEKEIFNLSFDIMKLKPWAHAPFHEFCP